MDCVPVAVGKCVRMGHNKQGVQECKICDFLQYGWPINYTSQTEPAIPIRNHSSACFYKQIISMTMFP